MTPRPRAGSSVPSLSGPGSPRRIPVSSVRKARPRPTNLPRVLILAHDGPQHQARLLQQHRPGRAVALDPGAGRRRVRGQEGRPRGVEGDEAKHSFGILPILEYDGTTLCQSMAIARFLAREFNLAGKDSLSMAKADMIVDCVKDFGHSAVMIKFEADEARKATMLEKFKTETAPTFFANMEKALAANGGQHFVGDELTYADLAVAGMLDAAKHRMKFFEWGPMAPTLEAFAATITDLPNIKKWIETRPPIPEMN